MKVHSKNHDVRHKKVKHKIKLKHKCKKRRVKRNSVSVKDDDKEEKEKEHNTSETQPNDEITQLQNFQRKQRIVNRLQDITKKHKIKEQEAKNVKDKKKSKIVFGSKILGIILGGILSFFL